MKVSVIMTSYNKPEYVNKAIEGVLHQTMGDFELLLMDDNSSKATQDVIAPYLRDKRIKYYRSKIRTLHDRTSRIRYAVLINEAIVLSKGLYVTYATDDNVYHKERLALMGEYLDVHSFAQIVYSSSITRHIDQEGTVLRTTNRNADEVTWLAPCSVDHCSVMHRRSILPTIKRRWGSFWDEDPQFYRIGDARFFWRLNQYWPFYPIKEILDYNYITVHSLHHQLFQADKNAFVRKLPQQRTCHELRESLIRR